MSLKNTSEVFLLAENRLLREALVRLLAKKDIRVVGANSYSSNVLEEIKAKNPGTIVLDSGGLAFSNAGLISALRLALPCVKIVMVDMDCDEDIFLRAVREGVVGYVLKDASAIEVSATIRAVVAGEAVCPPSLSLCLFRAASQQSKADSILPWGTELGLSRREQQLVELLRGHLTNKEIAVQLNLSEQTVKNHIYNISRKVGATNRSNIVRLCEMERLRGGSGSDN